jgi:hypothetical protein
LQEIRLPAIAGTIVANQNLNLLGMGATILALQARWSAVALCGAA